MGQVTGGNEERDNSWDAKKKMKIVISDRGRLWGLWNTYGML